MLVISFNLSDKRISTQPMAAYTNSVTESFNGDDGEVFYEALDNIDDSSNVVDSGVFGKITSAIKGLKAFLDTEI